MHEAAASDSSEEEYVYPPGHSSAPPPSGDVPVLFPKSVKKAYVRFSLSSGRDVSAFDAPSYRALSTATPARSPKTMRAKHNALPD